MNRKITSHERMDIEGRYYITEGGNHRLMARSGLAEQENHITTDLYLNEEKTFGSGSIWVYCPQSQRILRVRVSVMHGNVDIQVVGDLPGEIKDDRKTEGGEEE